MTVSVVSYLFLQHHANRAFFIQLLSEFDHFPPKILHFLLFKDVWRADALILLLRTPPLRRGAAELLLRRRQKSEFIGDALISVYVQYKTSH